LSFSDWIKSDKSERVWLEDSMTALGQFAFVNPLHRVKHYVQSKNRRVDCWAERTGKCIYCENGIMKVNDYTYGIFTEKGDNTIKYMGSVNLSTHTLIQNIFSDLFDNNINPCDLVFEITKTKITNLNGNKVSGYDIKPSDEEMFVKEVFRPSPLNAFQNIVRDFRWVVPEELVIKLVDLDGHPISLIDLFLKIKEISNIEDNIAKKYAIRLLENGVVDLKKSKEFRK
tara:strand:+ start:3255 stop:3938 length:684 start_codon:yes stop_codon:yes gene_type:complete